MEARVANNLQKNSFVLPSAGEDDGKWSRGTKLLLIFHLLIT